VAYPLPPEQPTRTAPRRRPVRRPPVPAVRFAITEGVLLPVTEAVSLTDRMHRAAVKTLDTIRGEKHHDSVLAGRDAAGAMLKGHGHAHYLALPDGQRRIAELAVWIPDGLPEDEFDALARIRRLWPPGEKAPGPGTVEVRLAACGDASTVLPDLASRARTWRSLTPFVPPRHPKREWHDFVESEIRRELGYRRPDTPASVTVTDTDWTSYTRRRPSQRFTGKPSGPSITRGAAVQLTFDEPVAGPIALGYLAHFGLGLFQPVHRA
jgi:CRISPR-associated protein Csb2